MLTPPKPDDEAERLEALQALRVLDTPAEERFDRVTRMARRLFDVPIALVSLVDADRQWFKSCIGLGSSETSRDVSFCGHAILRDACFIVEDAQQDLRFADNPLVTGPPHVRFYAGWPLRAPGGARIGTLCLIDTRPRSFSATESDMLGDLAMLVERDLAADADATIDPLTGLSNRRGFEALAEPSLAFCAQLDLPVRLLTADIAALPLIEALHGREEAARAVGAVAEAMRQVFEDQHATSRLEDGLFVALMANPAPADAVEAVEQLQQRAAVLYGQRRTADCELALRVSACVVRPTPFDGVDQLLAHALDAVS